jgi:hypothetical protein
MYCAETGVHEPNASRRDEDATPHHDTPLVDPCPSKRTARDVVTRPCSCVCEFLYARGAFSCRSQARARFERHPRPRLGCRKSSDARAHATRGASKRSSAQKKRAGRDDEVSAWNPRWEARSLIAQEQATPRPGVRSRADPARPQSLRTRNPPEHAVETAPGGAEAERAARHSRGSAAIVSRRISATRSGCSSAAKCPVSGSEIDVAPRSRARVASRSAGRDQSRSP